MKIGEYVRLGVMTKGIKGIFEKNLLLGYLSLKICFYCCLAVVLLNSNPLKFLKISFSVCELCQKIFSKIILNLRIFWGVFGLNFL